MKKIFATFVTVLLLGTLLSACKEAEANKPEPPTDVPLTQAEPTAAPSQTPYPTQTPYPPQTPYPTFTPLPVTATQVADISAAMFMPHENLELELTYQDNFDFVSIQDGSEITSFLSSRNDSNSTEMHNKITCKDQPYTADDIPIQPHLIPQENEQVFGDHSVTYRNIAPRNSFVIYFLQGNCFIEAYYHDPGFSGLEILNEIARTIEERLPYTSPEAGLIFPSYEVDPSAAEEYFFSVEAGNRFVQDWQIYAYMANLDIRKPFIKEMILGVYDPDLKMFISKKVYVGNIKVGENLYQVNGMLTPRIDDQYQLWVWVNGKLAAVVEMPYN